MKYKLDFGSSNASLPVLSSTVLLGKNISSKDTSNKSKDETSTSEHNLDWDNFS
jgi:hypothetical protein